MTNGWPIWRDDHPLYYHSAIVTRAFLKDSWTTAGYDPSFMSGYAKSVVFPSSSTLPELAIALFGGDHPELRLQGLCARLGRGRPVALRAGMCLVENSCRRNRDRGVIAADLRVDRLSDRYVQLGMVPYFLVIPLALAATGAFARFLDSGGAINWLMAAVALEPGAPGTFDDGHGGVASRSGRIYRGGPRAQGRSQTNSKLQALPAPARRRWLIAMRRPGDQCVLVAAGNLAVGNKRGKRFRLAPHRRSAATARSDRQHRSAC